MHFCRIESIDLTINYKTKQIVLICVEHDGYDVGIRQFQNVVTTCIIKHFIFHCQYCFSHVMYLFIC